MVLFRTRRNTRLRASLALAVVSACLCSAPKSWGADRQVVVEGLRSPESIAMGPDGRLYVTEIGRSGVNGDGAVAIIENGKPKEFAKGLDDTKGLVVHGSDFFVADKTRVWRIDSN